MVKKIVAMIMVSIMILSMAACSSGESQKVTPDTEEKSNNGEAEVETVIGEFEYSCQSSDVDAMLACLDEGVKETLYTGRTLLNWMTTVNNTDEIVMNAMLLSLLHISDISVDLTTMNIDIEEIVVDGGMANAKITMELNGASEVYREKMTMRLASNEDGWFITGVTS